MTSRRGFLLGLGAALAAPAVVHAGSLMPLWVPKPRIITAFDIGGPDDVVTGQLWLNGREVRWAGVWRKVAGRVLYTFEDRANGIDRYSGDQSPGFAMKIMDQFGITPITDRIIIADPREQPDA